MSFFSIVWKNLWRHRTRSLLSAAGVAIGVAAGVAMAAIAVGFQRGLEGVHAARRTDMVLGGTANRNPMLSVFEQNHIADVAALPGVQAIARADWDILPMDDGPPTVVYGWEPGTYLWQHLSIREGKVRTDGDSESSIYLGTLCAEVLGKKLGDTVRIDRWELRVAAIFHSDALLENGAALLSLPVFQSILGREGRIKHVNIRLAAGMSPKQFEELRRTIQARFPGIGAFRASELASSNTGPRVFKAVSLATSGIALLIGTLGIMNTLLMSVFERTGEIGLLMAVGWRRGRVLAMVLLESLILSLAGALAGVTAAILAVRIMQSTELLRGKIEGAFSPGLVGAAFAVAAGLSILGGLYPAARAASLQPQRALRRA
jgi:putative ABC transport system permease protein